MNNFILPLLMAQQQMSNDVQAGPYDFLKSIIPFVLIIGIFYFLIIRPQNKKRKDTEKMLSALKKGDKIVTVGGIHGTVQSVKESTVIVKVDDNVKLEFSRSAVSGVTTSGKEESKGQQEDQSSDTE